MHKIYLTFALLFSCSSILSLQAADPQLDAALAALKNVGVQGKGQADAVQATAALSALPASSLVPLLTALNGASPLEANWLRGAIETLFDREVKTQATSMQSDLEKFTLATANSPRARRLAFELLTRIKKSAPQELLPQMLDDPSLELRRDAVDHALTELEAAKLAPPQHLAAYEKLYKKARDLDQIDKMATSLREQGAKVDQPRDMGFVMTWRVIGPFDNREKKGFSVAYPPEKEINPTATYDGKEAPVKWLAAESTDRYGDVDLNKAIGKHMGAVAYALAEFEVDQETPCQLRLGSINANKIWLNGELLHEREVYHASTKIDQYTARGVLKPGRNTILLKICQNEQTEVWAQDWKFQLRVCDDIGTAILAKNRAETPAAALEPPPPKEKK
jgi:hypothetical protein